MRASPSLRAGLLGLALAGYQCGGSSFTGTGQTGPDASSEEGGSSGGSGGSSGGSSSSSGGSSGGADSGRSFACGPGGLTCDPATSYCSHFVGTVVLLDAAANYSCAPLPACDAADICSCLPSSPTNSCTCTDQGGDITANCSCRICAAP